MRYGLLLLLLWSALACANDGAGGVAGEGGRMRLLNGEHPSVRMVKEWVRIDIYPTYYQVSVQFHFVNTGAADVVKMGFPEGGGGDGDGAGDFREYRRRSGYSHFSTMVDGKPVTATRTVNVVEDNRYDALWIKTVPFARGQTRSVRVEYRASPGFNSMVGEGWRSVVGYHFTGGNWQGTVEQSDLLLVSHVPGALLLVPGIPDRMKVTHLGQQGNRLAITWKDWQAEGDFSIEFLLSYQHWLVFAGKEKPAFGDYDHRPMLIPIYTLTVPGIPPWLGWSPPAMQRDGVVYVKLRALTRYLSAQAEAAQQYRQVALSWDGSAVLQAGVHTFRFTRGESTMQVNGETVLLPARVLLSVPVRDEEFYDSQLLYAPLEPIVKALDGSMEVDADNRALTLEIPPFWRNTGAMQHDADNNRR